MDYITISAEKIFVKRVFIILSFFVLSLFISNCSSGKEVIENRSNAKITDKTSQIMVYRVNSIDEYYRWDDESKHTLLKTITINDPQGKNIISTFVDLINNPFSYSGEPCDCDGFPKYRISSDLGDFYITDYNYVLLRKDDKIIRRGFNDESIIIRNEFASFIESLDLD